MDIIVFSISEAVCFRLFVNCLPYGFFKLIIRPFQSSNEICSGVKAEARFELRQGEYDSIAADIRSGRVDFGFVNPEFVTGIETEPVYSDTMMAVLPKSSPLGKQAAVSLMQLEHLPYILLDEGEHSVALKAFETYHLHPDIRYKVTDDYSILTMVQKEMGYSILFRLTLAGYAKDVAVVPITEPFERTIALAWRNYDALSYAAKTFLSFIRTHAPEVLRQLER